MAKVNLCLSFGSLLFAFVGINMSSKKHPPCTTVASGPQCWICHLQAGHKDDEISTISEENIVFLLLYFVPQ